MINISEPKISSENIAAVLAALESNSVSTYGGEIVEFEAKLKSHTGMNVIAVNSGTSALEISIDCLFGDLSRQNKKAVGFCDYTFIATPNAILNTSNLPVCVSCNPYDFTPNLEHVERLIDGPDGIDLFILTLPFGNFNQKIKNVVELCHTRGVPVIIDAAASIALDFKLLEETFAKCVAVCLSFNGNKVITSGAGGAILSVDEDFILKGCHLLSLYRTENYHHLAPGQNKRMPALNASLGLSQLCELSERVKLRKNVFKQYQVFGDKFEKLGFVFTPGDEYSQLSYWLCFLKPQAVRHDIQRIRARLKVSGFNSPAFWTPVSKQLQYRNYIKVGHDFPEVEYPDLLQLPVTLVNSEENIEKFLKVMENIS